MRAFRDHANRMSFYQLAGSQRRWRRCASRGSVSAERTLLGALGRRRSSRDVGGLRDSEEGSGHSKHGEQGDAGLWTGRVWQTAETGAFERLGIYVP